ncbi:MAG: aminotransferase class III-fold pyridoxal phosphate-dependent enzyme [Bifidobacteriaceae bacterium]|jgi:glutamate-1-semialdehyde 2,1-aminomutase|nr:aminotransferase class III-fold pyridoxal phosphate-dependent enzyme [Bifidobacteriaceae bacterium]
MTITLETSLATFRSRFRKSGELTEKTRALIPGGFSRRTFNFGPHAIFAESGEGPWIHTVDGLTLLDLNNNFTVNILGHRHPAITRALEEALSQGFSFGNPTSAEAELAHLLVDRIESVERIQFSCSASESCLSAVRIARGFTGKSKIAKFEGGYHGFTDGLAISAHPGPTPDAGPDSDPQPVADTAGIPPADLDAAVILPQNDPVNCERILRANASEIACLIRELQSGAGGVVALDVDFVQLLRDLTKALGIVLVFDETISLRAGYHGLQGIYGVKPDLTVMGKMIGGGLPIGAVGGSAEVMQVVEDDVVRISGTHHGHCLSLAAGAACMETMDQTAFARLNAMAARVVLEVNEWSLRENYPFQIYGQGFSHLAYAFTDRPDRRIHTHRDFWRYVDTAKTFTCSLELANRGYFPVHRGELSLSLPMSSDDITGFIETTKEIVTGIQT